MDDFAKWLFRIVAVIGAVAFVTTYAMRHDFSRGWMPSFSEDYAPPPAVGAAPAPSSEVTKSEPAAEPAKEAAKPAMAAVPAAAPQAARNYVPCQPIGRTAKGELVYSMDCRTPPQ
ncbi:hypothetical protein [Rhodopseudomonas sp. B29]|uniref:hypothetical protein n=1 Tax=Rhodopseudomonas sp. B29 TaxID=95607 RepID=UPI0004CE0813|nr:hypothetical protein [Rhodopseudomonas sp. B29]